MGTGMGTGGLNGAGGLGELDELARFLMDDPSNEWAHTVEAYPTHTIFDPPNEILITDPLRTRSHPSHGKRDISFTTRNQKFVIHLCFLIRRILRLHLIERTTFSSSSASDSTTTTGSTQQQRRNHNYIVAPILAVMTPCTDILTLHNTLLEWFDRLPADFKAFNSLDDFVGPQHFSFSSPLPDPVPGNPPEWTKCPAAVFGNMIFVGAFVFLHHKNVGRGGRVYGTSAAAARGTGSGRCVSSMDILKMCFEAHVWMIKTLHVVAGFPRGALPFSPADLINGVENPAAASASTGGKQPDNPTERFAGIFFSESLPAPPWQLISNPLTVFLVYVSGSALMTLVLQKGHGEEGDEFDEAMRLRMVREVIEVVIPVMDNISRVWRVAGFYAERMRVIVRDVLSRAGTGIGWTTGAGPGGMRNPEQGRVNEILHEVFMGTPGADCDAE
ncbi:hypothetical protein HK102_011360, partial [Quaeritorhiza haematococci]